MDEQHTSASPAPRDAPGGAPAAGGDAGGRRGRARLEAMLQAVASALRRAAPVVTGQALRFGNWLVQIGWGKFFLIAALLIAMGGMLESIFPRETGRTKVKVPVDVVVSIDNDGMHIVGPSAGKAAAGAAAGAPAGAGNAPPAAPEPQINFDKKGVHIQADDDDGRKVSVVIDAKGVRIEKAPPPAAGAAAAGADAGKAGSEGKAGKGSGEVTVARDAIGDPEKVADAVEAAHDKIEEIVQAQVDQKLAHLHPGELRVAHSSSGMAEKALLLVFLLVIVKIALGSKRRAESRAQVADAVAAEEGLKRQLAEAQLKAMQAQVEPHFLFNTLASVDYLIETDPSRASRMQKNLIQYLRAALPQMRQGSSTLGQEMALCRSYLEILKVRMDERLQFSITMPAGLSSASFPPMMLQTLVENAIKHGLEPKPDGGSLNLNAAVVDGGLRVAVSDTGLGFGVAGAKGDGVGLNNVRERLKALFGTRAKLTIEPNSPNGTIATIDVPYSVGTIGAAPADLPAMPPSSPNPAQA